ERRGAAAPGRGDRRRRPVARAVRGGRGAPGRPRRRPRPERDARPRDARSARPRLSSLPGMFTGIVRERGRLVGRNGGPDGVELVVEAPETAAATHTGDSVALDGVCLTATNVSDGRIAFHAVAETLRRSTLAGLEPGAEVNVEPALRAGEPLGGHYVQGHVDGVGRVTHTTPEGDGLRLGIHVPPELLRYCVPKGSIAIQGV